MRNIGVGLHPRAEFVHVFVEVTWNKKAGEERAEEKPELTPQALVMGPRGQRRERLRESQLRLSSPLPSLQDMCV